MMSLPLCGRGGIKQWSQAELASTVTFDRFEMQDEHAQDELPR